jgi:hypothetical protein
MRKFAAIALFAVASTFGVGHAFAQQEYQLRTNIPFNFTVGNKVLPAGHYTILPVRDDQIEVQSQDGQTAVLSAAYPHSDPLLRNAVLVFNRYGDEYFLRQVDAGATSVNQNLPLSKSEDRARHDERLALNHSQVSIPVSEGN